MMLHNSCENKCVGNYGCLLSEVGVGGEREFAPRSGVIKDKLIQSLSGCVCRCDQINVSARL